MTDQAIFFGMFTTFILAHYEPASPLRWHMQDSVKMGLGNAWTTKYCMFATCLLVHSVDLFCVAAAKGISIITLLHLGMFWGKGPGAYERGIFDQHWGCHKESHIQNVDENRLCDPMLIETGQYFEAKI